VTSTTLVAGLLSSHTL